MPSETSWLKALSRELDLREAAWQVQMHELRKPMKAMCCERDCIPAKLVQGKLEPKVEEHLHSEPKCEADKESSAIDQIAKAIGGAL